jgi:hypothetical protein
MSTIENSAVDLLQVLSGTVRGPRREGVYALWLTLRVAEGYLLDPPLPERAARRRLAALESRLSSLTLPPPLRRALTAALAHLKEGDAAAVPGMLAGLVAPARDTTGAETAEAIQRAARAARAAAPRAAG